MDYDIFICTVVAACKARVFLMADERNGNYVTLLFVKSTVGYKNTCCSVEQVFCIEALF
jgi:hypothetical protein